MLLSVLQSAFSAGFRSAYNQLAGGLFIPNQVDGIEDPLIIGWYDTSDTSPENITESGGFVSALADKTGRGYHLVQGAGSSQPQTGVDTIGGLNVLTTGGSNDYLDAEGVRIGTSGNLYVICVAKVISTNNGQDSIVSMDTTSGQDWQLDARANGIYRPRVNTPAATNPELLGGDFIGYDCVYEVVFDKDTDNVVTLFVNGVQGEIDAMGSSFLTSVLNLHYGTHRGKTREAEALLGTLIVSNTNDSATWTAYRNKLAADFSIELLPFIFDRYPTDALIGYSALPLRTGMTGTNLYTVRRASDNTTITVTRREIVEGTLATFCAGTDGFIVDASDHEGSDTSTQATTTQQPQIVAAGVVLTDGVGSPAIVFDGVDDNLGGIGTLGSATAANVYAVTGNGDAVTRTTLTGQDLSLVTDWNTILSSLTYDRVVALAVYDSAANQAEIEAMLDIQFLPYIFAEDSIALEMESGELLEL